MIPDRDIAVDSATESGNWISSATRARARLYDAIARHARTAQCTAFRAFRFPRSTEDTGRYFLYSRHKECATFPGLLWRADKYFENIPPRDRRTAETVFAAALLLLSACLNGTRAAK